MNLFENISISFSYSYYLFLFSVILIAAYTIFIYRTTLPIVNNLIKSILVILRFLSLFLILILIFDPTLKISSSKTEEPLNLIFFDDSKSIKNFADKNDLELYKKLKNELSNDINGDTKYFTFSNELYKIENAKNDTLNFSGSTTNYLPIIKEIKYNKNISSVVIVSDGIINEGENPEFEFANISSPIYTIGIGDTTFYSDIAIEQIINNEYIYTNKETEIEVVIRNNGFYEKNAQVKMFEENNLLQTQNIILSQTGINRTKFNYKTDKEGKHNITIKVYSEEKERNISNNSKSTLINVLNSKRKIGIVAGSPSADLSFVVESIKRNDNFELHLIVEINANKYLNNISDVSAIAQSDLILLIGFPSTKNNPNFIKQVEELIYTKKIPFLFLTSTGIDFTHINSLSKILPFSAKSFSGKFIEDQVVTFIATSGIINNSTSVQDTWKNLPPISINTTNIVPNVNSEILLKDKNNQIFPILFTNQTGANKSIILNAANIWRWKLKTTEKDYMLFDNFILNSIKWLSTKTSDQFFSVKSNKKNYNLGEQVIFNANLYSEILEPIENQKIMLALKNGDEIRSSNFFNIGSGLYELNIDITKPGLYEYEVELEKNERNLAKIVGAFTVDPIDMENIENRFNKKLLSSIAEKTGGQFTFVNNTKNIINEINTNYLNNTHSLIIDNELRLSNLELILLMIVLLLSAEWIIRKVYRMI